MKVNFSLIKRTQAIYTIFSDLSSLHILYIFINCAICPRVSMYKSNIFVKWVWLYHTQRDVTRYMVELGPSLHKMFNPMGPGLFWPLKPQGGSFSPARTLIANNASLDHGRNLNFWEKIALCMIFPTRYHTFQYLTYGLIVTANLPEVVRCDL